MRKILLICLIIFNCSFFYSQNRIEKLEQLFDKFTSVIYKDTDSAYYYCRQAEQLNEKIGNDFYKSRCFFLYALYYYNINNNLKSGEYNDKALLLAKRTNNVDALYRIYNLRGVIFFEANEYDKAFNEYQKTKQYLEKKPDNKYFGIIHLNLGNLLIAKGDTVSAVKNYELIPRYSMLAKDTARQIAAYFLLANTFKKKNIKKAHRYYEKAFYLAKLTHDKREQFNIRINQSGNFLDSKNALRNKKALGYLQKAEDIAKQLGDKSLYFYTNFNYGAYCMNINDDQNAIKYYELAYKFYDQNTVPIKQKLDILKNLSGIYKKTQDYKKTFEYQNLFYKLKDSLFTIEKENNYSRLLAKFEVEKKNSQIQLLGKENQLQKVKKARMYYVLVFVFFLLILGFLFYQNKLISQERLNIKQQELNKAKASLDGQTLERNRLAKELHDGVSGSLAGINFMLDKENVNFNSSGIFRIQEQISTVQEEIREISHNLSSRFLEEKTFYQLVQHLAEQNEEKGIFSTEIIFFPQNALEKIEGELKTNLYRIIQELVNNIRKHANANTVEISVTHQEKSVCIMIEDDGKGFCLNNQAGIGLKNINERLKIFDANMEIDSYPNNGTTITITFTL